MSKVLLGSAERPLRVAIVGGGPSAFYTAENLFNRADVVADVHMIERLPTPHGLVRSGVAPDHQKIKNVTRVYERIADHPHFRFFGNITVGKHVAAADLAERYDAVIYAVGANADRRLGIPGEDLPGSWSATEFVGWYNGDPAYQDRDFDLSAVDSVVVIGVGNVSMDITRILVSETSRLEGTDITDEALDILRKRGVKHVRVIGRRGAAQVKFSPSEIREIGNLENVDLIIAPKQARLDALSKAWVDGHKDRNVRKNVDYLLGRAEAGPEGGHRQVRLTLLRSPIELIEKDGRLAGVRLEKNVLRLDEGPEPKPRGTGEFEDVPCQVLIRSVGYRGEPLPGVPFDRRRNVIPNDTGRVVDPETREVIPGLYAVGWIKRGPTGLVGANKADAIETVGALVEDLVGRPAPDDSTTVEDLADWLAENSPDVVDLERWRRIDAIEREQGEARGKVRHKFIRVQDMLDVSR